MITYDQKNLLQSLVQAELKFKEIIYYMKITDESLIKEIRKNWIRMKKTWDTKEYTNINPWISGEDK